MSAELKHLEEKVSENLVQRAKDIIQKAKGQK